jgi:hypothetical protein
MRKEVKLAFVIPIVFVLGFIISNIATRYGGLSVNQYWIYKWGNLMGVLIFYGTIVWSVYQVVILSRTSTMQLINRIFCASFTAIPLLYFLFMIMTGKD